MGKLTIKVFGQNLVMAPTSSNHFIAIDVPSNIELEFEDPGLDKSFHLFADLEGRNPDVFQRLDFVPLNSGQLMDFAGEYRCEELDTTYKIIVEDSKLLLNRGNSPQEILKPISEDLLKGTYTTLQFIRDDHGQVTGFNLGTAGVKNVRFAK